MRDIEERQESREGPRKPKVTTLTDMKAKRNAVIT